MYRVFAIVGVGFALAACSTTPSWLSFHSGPTMETVRFESEPPGAEVKVSNGQSCRTPCALALADNAAYAVTFTLNGFQPASEQIEPLSLDDNIKQLRPNPVLAALTPMPPPPKPVKKPVRRKTVAKPAAKPAAKYPPSAAPAPIQQQAPSPWPSAPTR